MNGFFAAGSSDRASAHPAAGIVLLACLVGGSALAGEPERVFVCAGPDGALALASTDAPGACRPMLLPVPSRSVRWIGRLAPPAPPARDRLVLAGTGRGALFAPSAARFEEPEARTPPPAALPLDRPLLPGVSARLFGVEERASVSRTDGAIVLVCRAGTRPAGLLLDPGEHRLPNGAAFVVRWQAAGDAGFAAAVAGAHGDGNARPLAPGTSDDHPPPGEEAGTTPRFVVTCPDAGGTLTLSDLRLASRPARTVDRGVARSAWAWQARRWREAPERLIADARDLGVTRLFVSVEIAGDAIVDEPRLSAFVASAKRTGVAVVAVEGDPGMALAAGRAAGLERLRALVAYQMRATLQSRLDGVQYDIEPYLLPAFTTDPEGVVRGWAKTLAALARTAPPLELDLVLPFWLPQHPAAGPVMAAVHASAARLIVMAYRSTVSDVLAVAEPMLAWSTAAALPLQVALEAGPVDDETTRLYARADTGDVWRVTSPGGDDLVLVLHAPRAAGADDRVYALDRETVFPGARVSFLGDRRRLEETATTLAPTLSAWPSFSGFALHGLIE